MLIKDYFLPSYIETALQRAGLFHLSLRPLDSGEHPTDVQVQHLQVTPQALPIIAQALRERRRELHRESSAHPDPVLIDPRTAYTRLASLRLLSSRLSQAGGAFRQEALALMPRISGFSTQMVRLLLDSFTATFGLAGPELMQVVLPHNKTARHFTQTPHGFARYYPGKAGFSISGLLARDEHAVRPGGRFLQAAPPGLVTSIAAGNVPGISIAQAFFPLLIGAACLGKNPSEEPYFGPRFAAELAALEAEQAVFPLSDLLALVTFSGGEKSLVEEIIHQGDHLIITGGHDARRSVGHIVRNLRSRSRRDLLRRVSGHWHKVSFDVVGREFLTPEWVDLVAFNVAFDNSMFNTQGCLSCQQVFVEGQEDEILAFAGRYIHHMKSILHHLPKVGCDSSGCCYGDAQAGLRQMYTEFEKKPGVKILTRLKDMQAEPFFVAYDGQSRDFAVYNALNRSILIRRLQHLENDLPPLLGTGAMKDLLQSCAVAVSQDRLLPLAGLLGRAGVNRIVAAGGIWNMVPGVESWDGYLPPYDLLAPQLGYWTTINFHHPEQALQDNRALNLALLEMEPAPIGEPGLTAPAKI